MLPKELGVSQEVGVLGVGPRVPQDLGIPQEKLHQAFRFLKTQECLKN